MAGNNDKGIIHISDKGGDVWAVATQSEDTQHDIELDVEIDMPEMTITDSRIKFNRFPVEHCPLIVIQTGKIDAEQFDHMIKTDLKNACLAHTLQEL
jgi:hypothetical protein